MFFNATDSARIDGLTITGTYNSNGVLVNAYADFLEISNNIIANNQGSLGAGGIRVGYLAPPVTEAIATSSDNDYVNIHHNHVVQNGGISAPGAGIGLYSGSNNYSVTNNYVCGNFAQQDGAGIAHYGLSDNGLIADNKILLNQTFQQTPGGGNGGGILIAGIEPVQPPAGTGISAGSGSVKVLRNHIQANAAGSGDGGGIAISAANGQDILASPTQSTWHHIDILNNIIVNNVAGMTAGGISLKDAVMVSIVNNTVMDNDSTGTSFNAFGTCTPTLLFPNESCPQPAGIVSYAHSLGLTNTGGAFAPFSDPTMVNNIVLGNRSHFWQVTGGVGELILVPGPNDFSVFPPTAGTLTTMNSVITTGSIGSGDVLDGGSNSEVDATIPLGATPCPTRTGQCSIAENPYHNSPPGFVMVQPDGTVIPAGEFPAVEVAAALDEGGNFIDVHYGPLSPVGDYHLQTDAANVAIDAGATPSAWPDSVVDIDREARPAGCNCRHRGI